MVLHVVTGPLAAGKSTYVRELAKKLKTKAVREFPYGIDISEENWWEDLKSYADSHNTIIVEAHFDHRGLDAHDYFSRKKKELPLTKPHIKPPSSIKVHWVLPTLEQLHKQQKGRDPFETKEFAEYCLAYYKTLQEKMQL